MRFLLPCALHKPTEPTLWTPKLLKTSLRPAGKTILAKIRNSSSMGLTYSREGAGSATLPVTWELSLLACVYPDFNSGYQYQSGMAIKSRQPHALHKEHNKWKRVERMQGSFYLFWFSEIKSQCPAVRFFSSQRRQAKEAPLWPPAPPPGPSAERGDLISLWAYP